MEILRKLKAHMVRALEIILLTSMGVLVLDVAWQVFTRKVLLAQSTWTTELATYLLIWVALLGASVGFIRKSHLGVDYFVNKLPARPKAVVEILVYFIVAFFASAIMVYGGYLIVAQQLSAGQTSPSLGVNMGYVYLAVPIGGIFVLLASLETAVEKIAEFGKEKPEEPESAQS